MNPTLSPTLQTITIIQVTQVGITSIKCYVLITISLCNYNSHIMILTIVVSALLLYCNTSTITQVQNSSLLEVILNEISSRNRHVQFDLHFYFYIYCISHCYHAKWFLLIIINLGCTGCSIGTGKYKHIPYSNYQQCFCCDKCAISLHKDSEHHCSQQAQRTKGNKRNNGVTSHRRGVSCVRHKCP